MVQTYFIANRFIFVVISFNGEESVSIYSGKDRTTVLVAGSFSSREGAFLPAFIDSVLPRLGYTLSEQPGMFSPIP